MTSPEAVVVVSDTSPINYLALTGYIDVLPSLYEKIAIPQAVYDELTPADTPATVRAWTEQQPEWVTVQTAPSLMTFKGLDQGEREALSLAFHLKADLLLLDDGAAREVANERGLLITGTVGILAKAAENDLLSLPEAFQKLKETSFRIGDKLLEATLERDQRLRQKRVKAQE